MKLNDDLSNEKSNPDRLTWDSFELAHEPPNKTYTLDELDKKLKSQPIPPKHITNEKPRRNSILNNIMLFILIFVVIITALPYIGINSHPPSQVIIASDLTTYMRNVPNTTTEPVNNTIYNQTVNNTYTYPQSYWENYTYVVVAGGGGNSEIYYGGGGSGGYVYYNKTVEIYK